MRTLRTTRRDFISSVAAASVSASFVSVKAADAPVYKAAIIGRTGHGDYGHGFDTIFEGLPNVSVEAIADDNPEGLKRAAERSKAKRQYSDFREMLRKERPHLVSIAPRQPGLHKEMALAAMEVGAHLIMEKPFTEHLDDADEVVRIARGRKLQIVVGHKNRYTDHFARMQRHLKEGFLGQILEMRVQGKQDQRSGGEDLIVLGTHDFDAMRFFFGDPISCYATVFAGGKPATKADVRKGREPMLMAGDTVRARFDFPNNAVCTWQSIRAGDDWNIPPRGAERWGFHIFGTKRILAYYSGSEPLYYDSPFLGHKTKVSDWKPLSDPGDWPPKPHQKHLVRDLIHAIESGDRPLCGANDGRWTIEMVAAVYESHLVSAKVLFPLKNRVNPLLRF